jgi:hypothetical protein
VERFAQSHFLLGKVNILLATRANSGHLGWRKKINSLNKQMAIRLGKGFLKKEKHKMICHSRCRVAAISSLRR